MASSSIAVPGNAPIRIAQSAAAAMPSEISKSPLLGILGVIIGAGVVTLTGRMISLGLADLKGDLGFGFDDGSWISSSYNIALMFIGPFTVYVGALLGPRRVSVPCSDFVHIDLSSGSVYPQLQPHDRCHGTGRTYLRHVLSADADVRVAQYSASISSVHRRAVCDVCGRSRQYCAIAIRLVPGAPFMALDVLELLR